MRYRILMLFPLLALGACGDRPADPRGVEHDETLLSVSATGRSETRPDEARFTAGVSRSEEHTSELQSLMRISYAVFCLKKKTNQITTLQRLAKSKHSERTPKRTTKPNYQ